MIFQYMFYSLEGGLPSSMKPNVSSALLGDIGCAKIIGNIRGAIFQVGPLLYISAASWWRAC